MIAVPSPKTLFPRAPLHTSAVARLATSKFGLGVPHYRVERDVADQGVPLDRGTMSRYMEHAGNTLGATIVQAMWSDAISNAQVISTALRSDSACEDRRERQCAGMQEGIGGGRP